MDLMEVRHFGAERFWHMHLDWTSIFAYQLPSSTGYTHGFEEFGVSIYILFQQTYASGSVLQL
jgi:hypothetical protein